MSHEPHGNPPGRNPGPEFHSPPPPGRGIPHGGGRPGVVPPPGYGVAPHPHASQPTPQPQYPNDVVPPPPGRKNPLIIAAALVAAALVGFGAAVATGVLNRGNPDQTTPETTTSVSGEPSPSPTSSRIPTNPVEVAEDYLNAVARGDAETARRMIVRQPDSDMSLLTEEVLKESLQRAPITDIKVQEKSGSPSTNGVEVTYTIGGELISDEFTVNMHERKIVSGLPSLFLSPLNGMAVKVNGVVPETDDPLVFPGIYQVTSANEYLELVGNNVIPKRYSSDLTYVDLKVQVSQAGIALYREKVIPEAKACLASTNLDPGCDMPMSATTRDGETITEGTIARTLDAEGRAAMENVVPQPDPVTPTIISAADFGDFTITAQCTTAAGSTGECLIRSGRGTLWSKATIDLGDPELKVVWGRR